jgi:hypothetical protein
MEIIAYISAHWVQWVFAGLLAVLGWGYRTVSARLRAEQEKNEAIAEGVQSLLRENIVSNYNKYTDRGFMPIYAKESLKSAYAAYHGLGGDDVATELYNKMLRMQEEKDD